MRPYPKVTVFIPAFNRQDYICTAINSILAQKYTDFEVLIVDDGSTDLTAQRVAAYSDPRVRLVSNERNLGIPASRNRGLELARGRYIALLDSDDYAYPQRLGRQVVFLDRHPDIAQVGSWCTLMNAKGKLLKKVRRHPLDPADIDAHLLFHCTLINRTIMARTDILRQYGYDESFPRCQDYDLHVRLARRHRMANLPELLVCGREHDGRITKLTPGLGRDRKMVIQAKVLDSLDIRPSEQDLSWHYLLTQRGRGQIESSRDYLEWAEAWLLGLVQANRRSGRFEPAAFARTIGAVWALVCWRHVDSKARDLPQLLLGSKLSLGIPRNLRPRWLTAIARHRARQPQLDPRWPETRAG